MKCQLAPVAALLLLAACVPPTRDYDTSQISGIKEFEELMWVHATVADPRFKLARNADRNAVTAEEFAAFADMGRRLQATARRIPEFSRGKGFDEYARELAQKAVNVERLAKAKDASVIDEVLSVKKTCAACHSDFR